MKKTSLFKTARFGMLTLLMLAATGCNSQNTQQVNQTKKSKNEKLMENKGKSYSIIFLNITDEQGYNKYRNSTDMLRKKYGGHIEREFDVMGKKGNIPDFEAPNRIVVMYWMNLTAMNRSRMTKTIKRHLAF